MRMAQSGGAARSEGWGRMLRRVRAAAGLLVLAACTPTLDWRSVQPPWVPIHGLFPCRPVLTTRLVDWDGARTDWSVAACDAGQRTWAWSWADVQDPARVPGVLRDLRLAAAANLGTAQRSEGEALRVSGATPHDESRLVRLQGRRPDGTAVAMTAAYFARGTQVFQAMVVGTPVHDGGEPIFFEALRAQP